MQTDSSCWSEEPANAEEDRLLAQLTAAIDVEPRKVRVDPDLGDDELLQLIDDELSGGRPSSLDIDHHQLSPDEYVFEHVGRLHRFLAQLDYLLDSSAS